MLIPQAKALGQKGLVLYLMNIGIIPPDALLGIYQGMQLLVVVTDLQVRFTLTSYKSYYPYIRI